MKVKVVIKNGVVLPVYKTANSAGMDLRAFLDNPVILGPLDRVLIPTGIFIQLPEGYEAQIRPRSGLALSDGITVLNSPGTIDADYRGEIGIILINLSKKNFVVNNGDRIAQIVFSKCDECEWELCESIENTERGNGGFGHTGKE